MTNKNILILALIIFSLSFISATEPVVVIGGGGRSYCYNMNFCSGDYNICNYTTGDCELNMTSFTGCLVQNCDNLCKQWGGGYFDNGTYYGEDKCWCERYSKSKYGNSVEDDGWIEITECNLKSDNNQEGKPTKTQIILIGALDFIILCAIIYIILEINKKNGN